MPFAQMIKEKLMKIGDSAFNVKLDFNEHQVLEVNKTYLENTLDVSMLFVSVFCFIIFIYICVCPVGIFGNQLLR